MDIKEIRRLVKLMAENDLSELEVADGENRIHLKRGLAQGAAVSVPPMVSGPAVSPGAPVPQEAAQPAAPHEGLIEIKSPMVGTYYAAPSPDGEPYVEVGAPISDDAVVCIIEAMKVMNEIKAECSGTIAEICVQDPQPVEFGQVLFRVRPG